MTERWTMLPEDCETHLGDFLTACRFRQQHCIIDSDDRAYWDKQVATIEKIQSLLAEAEEVGRPGAINTQYHCEICGGEVDLSNATQPTVKWAGGRGPKRKHEMGCMCSDCQTARTIHAR